MSSITTSFPAKSVTGLLFLPLLIFGSCKKDDPQPQDVISPEISLVGVTDQSSVWNTVPLTLDAADATGIAKVEIYVDGVLVSTLTAPPYALSWNSNDVTDGAHSIRGVAYDNSGNKSEKVVSVTVKNILVSINIAADQLSTDIKIRERGFVFLSDENGKVISVSEYKNSDKVTLKNPDFNGEYFYLTEVSKDTFGISLATFAQIERGKNWVLINPLPDNYAESATLNFLNAKPSPTYYYDAAPNGNVTYTIDEDHITSMASLRKSPTDLFVTLYDRDKGTPLKYFFYSGITAGANTIDLAQVTKDFSTQDFTFSDEFDWSSLRIYGLPDANNFDEYYSLSRYYYVRDLPNQQQSQKLYFPGSTFPTYYSEYYANSKNTFYEKGSTHDLLKLDLIKNDISFTFNENKLTYSASGDFDFFTILVGPTDSPWQFALPERNGVLPMFDIPAILKSYPIPAIDIPFAHIVQDYENMTGYEDLKSFIRKSGRSLSELYGVGINHTSILYLKPTTGGRLRPHRPFTRWNFEKHRQELPL
ncbi:Ig-like domain-containing protein [Chryseolinea soli]|uniref:Bacterial Ig-like domain-containing protein n=1 Tax=Chryseolinea soli TaxID=2321403 RepID=A0A385SC17_9BACT|nr:Ig-like domain-containing protein [Chryseolinea soli]AYB29173.1 hypothetical protein D4L85_00600 [Chryseolinea soli]